MKNNRLLSASGAAFFSAAIALAIAPAAHAAGFVTPDYDYTVTLNVASLVGNANGPFSLDLQLVQGSGNVSNTVKIYNFSTTGTSSGFGASDFNNGSESGTIGTGGIVTLTNSQSDDELAALINPGTTTISFNVDETPNSEIVASGSPTPDQFNVSILDSGENNIPTTDSGDAATQTWDLVKSDLGENPTLASYSSLSPDGGVTVITATPEPSSTALSLVAAGGLLGLVLVRRRYAA
jgi:hypothetical protein